MYTHIGYNPPGAKEEIAAVNDRVSNLEVDVDDLQATLAANEQLDATQNNRLGAIEVVNTTQNTSIASLTTRITTSEQLDTVQNTRLNAIEVANADQNTSITSLTTRITTSEQLDTVQNTRLNAIEVVNAAQNASWTPITTFQNGWSNFGPPFESVAVRKTSATRIEIQGAIKAAQTGLGKIAFTLPVGFRPSAPRSLLFVLDVTQFIRPVTVSINPDGTCVINGQAESTVNGPNTTILIFPGSSHFHLSINF